MAARTIVGEDLAPSRNRIATELLIEIGDQIVVAVLGFRILGLAFVLARHMQVGGVGFRGKQETQDVGQPVFDCTEVGAIAPALANIERRLPEVAPLRIDLAQIGQMVDPALFGARADVEVHTLDRLEPPD
jgi:hypothetical protein